MGAYLNKICPSWFLEWTNEALLYVFSLRGRGVLFSRIDFRQLMVHYDEPLLCRLGHEEGESNRGT